jgi:MoaA/NifB/PqqE/SkfB family radical SAM enzyme
MNLTIPYLTPSIQDGELEFVKYANFLAAMLDRRERSPRAGSNPIELTVDATLSCQLLCPYCETGSGAITRKPANLKAAFHDDLMNALGDTAFFVQYFSNGEPLLNKGLPAMIREHRRRETFSLISTNLSLPLSAERIDDLLTSGLGFICASVDGTTAESYQQYRVGGDFGLVVENIGKLVRRKQELGLTLPIIEWRFLVFRHNEGELDKAVRMAFELGVDVLEFFPGSAPPGDSGQPVYLSAVPIPAPTGPAIARALARTDRRLHRILKGQTHVEKERPREMQSRKCDWLYLGTMIYPDQGVAPCCLKAGQEYDFGHLDQDTSFESVWNGDSYLGARELFNGRGNHALLCTTCPLPPSQDYQFRSQLRAILRNAPDWALKLLGDNADRFFWPVDHHLCPVEIGALPAAAAEIEAYPHWLLERLEAAAREALTELKRGRLRQLAELAELGPGAAAIGAGTVPEAAAHPACG